MKISIVKMKTCLMMAMLVAGVPVLAAEMDHSTMGHSSMDHDSSLTVTSKSKGKAQLQKLAAIPTSGKAREGGYDESYVMESTDVSNTLPARCAQASRGLVMMSNAEWSRCGGRPEGAAQASRSVNNKATNEHAGHNM